MKIKKYIKKLIGKKNIERYKISKKIHSINKKENLIEIFLKCKVYKSYDKLFDKIVINSVSSIYFYSLDIYKTLYYDGDVISNLSLDYNRILNSSLEDFKKMMNNDEFSKKELECIISIEKLIEKEIEATNDDFIKDSLKGIKNRKANSFKDALQRILFYNQLMWQTNHYLNGLGRLDLILDSYYKRDLEKKLITKKTATILIKDFIKTLNYHYYFKSNSLYGDTGQIIVIGGTDSNNNYFCNDLSYMFIDIIKEMQLPDPKILLRVSKKVPREIMDLSLKCISTGIGCPLLANDDVIIPKLIEFGYDNKDAYNYATSACWEPFIPGKSFDQNNVKSISFMEPLRNINENDIQNINSLNDFLRFYKNKLNNYLDELINSVNNKKYGIDPLLSLLTDECINSKKDIALGGAKYNNIGFTGVGLSNIVNSMLIINKFVFKDKEITLKEFNEIRENNYLNHEKLIKKIKKYPDIFGKDEDYIINLSNEIIDYVSKKIENIVNPLGGKYKFGLSAPSYIDMSKDYPASFDGRKDKEPFNVHISSDNLNAYTELFNFASKLDYSINKFNGNVLDFIVTPNFINDNYNKFLDFLILSIKNGFFEMQMNVINSKTLIEARNNPEKFPNLIVRVWGFSAYFNDLPDEYKDYIIERTLKSEGNNN